MAGIAPISLGQDATERLRAPALMRGHMFAMTATRYSRLSRAAYSAIVIAFDGISLTDIGKLQIAYDPTASIIDVVQ
jgi:hypothetical protein